MKTKNYIAKLIGIMFAVCMIAGIPKVMVHAVDTIPEQIDSSFSDSLQERTEEKWYKLTTTNNSYFVINFMPDSFNTHGWNLSVYDSNYKEVKFYGSITENFISERITLGNNATFYIRVKGTFTENWAPVGERYTITTTQTNNPNWEKESNGTFKKANVLSSGKKKYGTIWKNDDVDIYAFTVTKNGYTTFKFATEDSDPTKGEHGWRITIYDSKGNEIYAEDTENSMYVSRKFNLKKGTKFYVKIGGKFTGNWAPVDCEYSIQAVEKASSTWEIESNNTLSKATVLKSSKYGTIYKRSDVDYYKYKATKNGKISIKFYVMDEVSNLHGWNLYVYQKSEKDSNLKLSEDGIVNDKTRKCSVKKGVTYYIKVVPKFTDNWAPIDVMYKLTIK